MGALFYRVGRGAHAAAQQTQQQEPFRIQVIRADRFSQVRHPRFNVCFRDDHPLNKTIREMVLSFHEHLLSLRVDALVSYNKIIMP